MITGSLDGPKDINYANRLTLDGEGTLTLFLIILKNLKLKTLKH